MRAKFIITFVFLMIGAILGHWATRPRSKLEVGLSNLGLFFGISYQPNTTPLTASLPNSSKVDPYVVESALVDIEALSLQVLRAWRDANGDFEFPTLVTSVTTFVRHSPSAFNDLLASRPELQAERNRAVDALLEDGRITDALTVAECDGASLARFILRQVREEPNFNPIEFIERLKLRSIADFVIPTAVDAIAAQLLPENLASFVTQAAEQGFASPTSIALLCKNFDSEAALDWLATSPLAPELQERAATESFQRLIGACPERGAAWLNTHPTFFALDFFASELAIRLWPENQRAASAWVNSIVSPALFDETLQHLSTIWTTHLSNQP